MRKVLAVCAALLAVLAVLAALPSRAVATGPTHCQPAVFTENSGNGPTYKVTICGALRTPLAEHKWQLIVDGGPLQNHAVIFGVQIPSGRATAAQTASEPRLSACFGNQGVEFGSLNAWLCEVKLGDDPSGGLYFTPSVDNGLNNANPSGQMVWYKLHAAPNAYYAWENYSEPWGTGDTPRANGRIIALDEGPAGQCILVWPSWTTLPTECFDVLDGGAVVQPPHPLDPAESYSVAEYAANMRAAVPLEYR